MKRRDAIEAIQKAFRKLNARKAGAEIRVDFVSSTGSSYSKTAPEPRDPEFEFKGWRFYAKTGLWENEATDGDDASVISPDQNLSGEGKRQHRLTHSKPRVEAFFAWIDRQFEQQGLTPTRPFTVALEYARERRMGLEVFLTDPDVSIDTNHLERALRAIPMGRKSWNFCWTELGAKHVGVAQSLIVTGRLHGIDPYTYLVDVLQRVGRHPAARVTELTPRLWKTHFAGNPLRSGLHTLTR